MGLRAALVSTCVVLSLSLAGCGGDPPDKEIQQAETAIAAARAAGADLYSADEIAAAATALQNANTAVEQHDYRLALNHALDSRERAENAARQAIDGKIAARAKADAALQAARLAIAPVRAKVKSAEGANAPPRGLAGARTALEQAERELQEAGSALERADYARAAKHASAVTGGLKAIEEQLSGAWPPPTRHRR